MAVQSVCPTCLTRYTPGQGCPTCTRDPSLTRNPMRNRSDQRRFRKAVLERDGHACVDCGATEDLRACHIVPLAKGGSWDPSNGVTRCRTHDMATDRYAR